MTFLKVENLFWEVKTLDAGCLQTKDKKTQHYFRKLQLRVSSNSLQDFSGYSGAVARHRMIIFRVIRVLSYVTVWSRRLRFRHSPHLSLGVQATNLQCR